MDPGCEYLLRMLKRHFAHNKYLEHYMKCHEH